MENIILGRLTTLGHPQRMAVFRLLMRRYPNAVPAGKLGQALGLKPSTLSVYLSALASVGLLGKTRHGTSLHYKVEMEAAREIMDYLFLDCCRGRPQLCPTIYSSQHKETSLVPNRKQNVIFICTGNSARSILAESILRQEAGDRYNAYSAGTRPAGVPNPLAMAVLQENGHAISDLRSKSLDEFQHDGAPKMDFIFTVCDSAANEECPFWPGQPISGHWGIPDPAAIEGSDAEKRQAFATAYNGMQVRIRAFIALSPTGVDKTTLQKHIDEIGAMAQTE
ncbi:MAG: ArsR family transcriptional regulator [Rhodobacterales bacterium]